GAALGLAGEEALDGREVSLGEGGSGLAVAADPRTVEIDVVLVVHQDNSRGSCALKMRTAGEPLASSRRRFWLPRRALRSTSMSVWQARRSAGHSRFSACTSPREK